MHILAKVLISLIAALHLYIAWFEIFAWTTRGPVVFPTFPADLFEPTITLAANQGIYNAFLAAGLIWSLFSRDARWHANVATCFLLFVLSLACSGPSRSALASLLCNRFPRSSPLSRFGWDSGALRRTFRVACPPRSP